MRYWTYAHHKGSNIRYRPVLLAQYDNQYIAGLVGGEWPEDKELVGLLHGKGRYNRGEVKDLGEQKHVSVSL